MNRPVIYGAVVLVVGLGLLLFLKPEVPKAPAPPAVPTRDVPAASPPDAPPAPAVPKPKLVLPVEDASDAGPAADAAPEPKGPFTTNLGEHRILLRERDGRFIEISAKLVTDDRETWRELRGRRRELVRMMFFLGTHRAADGAQADVGGEQFRADLQARFANVIRSSGWKLVIDRFEVIEVPEKDAGAE